MDLYNLVVSAKLSKGEGGDVEVDSLSVTENGTYTAQTGHAYNPVTVNVPQSGITPVGVKEIVSNGIYDVTDFASASVSVPIPSYSTSALNVTENGTYSVPSGVDGFNPVTVNVSGGGGGDHDAEDAMIMRTISGLYENSRINIIGTYAFGSCSNLNAVSFPNVSLIMPSAFRSCSSLASVYLLSSSVVRLSSINAFTGTLVSAGGGSIYVPASLVNSYKAASNWSAYADRITSYVE